MQLDLLKLFDGYVRNYHTLNLTIHHGNHSFTMSEIEYFSRLGSMLGYCSFTEDTCNGKDRPMDLTWWDNDDGEYWNDLILHLERENYFNKEEETLEKLFGNHACTPLNVFGILKVRNHERMEELIALTQKVCRIDNALLVFKTNSSGKNQPYLDEVHAYLFNKSKIVATKTAYISDISGTLYMYYKKEGSSG